MRFGLLFMANIKRISFLLIGIMLISGCQTQTLENSTTEQLIDTTTVENTSEDVKPLIYSGLEIIESKEYNTTLENGLIKIIEDLKKRKEYIDATEYLFYIETVTQDEKYVVLVKANYTDEQKLIAKYQISLENIERIE